MHAAFAWLLYVGNYAFYSFHKLINLHHFSNIVVALQITLINQKSAQFQETRLKSPVDFSLITSMSYVWTMFEQGTYELCNWFVCYINKISV